MAIIIVRSELKIKRDNVKKHNVRIHMPLAKFFSAHFMHRRKGRNRMPTVRRSFLHGALPAMQAALGIYSNMTYCSDDDEYDDDRDGCCANDRGTAAPKTDAPPGVPVGRSHARRWGGTCEEAADA